MNDKANNSPIVIKIILLIIGLVTVLLAYFSISPSEKRCLQGHYETVGGNNTTHPKNVWVCDKYVE